MNPWLMWSGPEAAGGVATTHPDLRRGHVWLAQAEPGRGQRAVLLLSRDRDGRSGDPLLAAPVIRGAPAIGRVAVEILEGFDGAVVDVRRLVAIDRSVLIQPLMRLAGPRLAEVDMALCEVLGLDVPAWHAVDGVELSPGPDDASPESDVYALPAIPAPSNGAAAHSQPPAAVLPAGAGQPAPPAPPPLLGSTTAADDDDINGENQIAGIDDHPIAQLFGRPRPVSYQAAAPVPPRAPVADIRVADVMPQLLAIVQRRLHRSAPRLEAVLSQAGDEGRTVEWAAAAVRHASVRGVMQSTLDEIAGEIAAVGALEARRPD